MQKIIDAAVKELISIIDSKKHSKKVAMQFVLEELDAARQGNDFVKDRIKVSLRQHSVTLLKG